MKTSRMPRKGIESRKVLILERQKRELEQALARLTVENVALESLIEEAQCHTGIDLKKLSVRGDSARNCGAVEERIQPCHSLFVPQFCVEPTGILPAR